MCKTKEKSLIINADDLGISPAVNEAVRGYYVSGTITGASLMACGEYFSDACSMLREINKKDIGVHLTLTGNFRPVTEDLSLVSTLLGKEKTFPEGYGSLVLKYFRNAIKADEIMREFGSQIEKVAREGFNITHIDSHEHIHMIPGILKKTIELAQKYKITYIRIPVEPLYVIKKSFSIKDLIRYTALRSASFFSCAMNSLENKKDIRHNTAFLGHFHSGRLDDEIILFMIKNLPQGIAEVALHPGTEETGLTSGAWKNAAESSGIKIITHREAVPFRPVIARKEQSE
ncbi:MAG: ChbG/HpnK family deacetylase [Candidatus Omnitrophota bacterium]